MRVLNFRFNNDHNLIAKNWISFVQQIFELTNTYGKYSIHSHFKLKLSFTVPTSYQTGENDQFLVVPLY